MRVRPSNLLYCAFWLFISLCAYQTSAHSLDLTSHDAGLIGKYVSFFQEDAETPLNLEQAIARFNEGQYIKSRSSSLSLGIGVRPVWIKLSVDNKTNINTLYRLAIETPWLDYIDSYHVYSDELVRQVTGGDGMAFEYRPMPYRYFAYETTFPKGEMDIYIRVETAGPMAIPLYLSSSQAAISRDIRQGYEYGVLYGIMLALGLYNLILFFLIRQPEFGLYSGYLFGFVANSLSYTGQIHAVFTPDFGPYFQDWMDISLMVTYSVLGLHFARTLLRTRHYAPGLDKFTFWVATLIPCGMALGALLSNLYISMILAFILNTSFVFLFMVLGYRAYQEKVNLALFFFISSVTAAACICISTAAVAGLLPLNDITFKLIEVGMAFEAIVLAVLLGDRFRSTQRKHERAERFARTDELTQVLNRRGFRLLADAVWRELSVRDNAAVVLLDIDKFKAINDTYGHGEGDRVIHEVASRLRSVARDGDIFARWGGEEFIVLLINTDIEQARFQAERLRKSIETAQFEIMQSKVPITVSVGVAGSNKGLFEGLPLSQQPLEKIISKADKALYEAKNSGRNQVSFYIHHASAS
ncbi:sensor domain-containing diguanylate cyclase [Alteromonas sediminis]|nr:diguanylate cyclase [Alteromonas sediminis]